MSRAASARRSGETPGQRQQPRARPGTSCGRCVLVPGKPVNTDAWNETAHLCYQQRDGAAVKNHAQLIAYVDRLPGGTFRDLKQLLNGPLRGVFGGVHVLPFFHPIDGADAGFDPIDHSQVDPRLGTWADVAALATDVDVMADLIVNHVSCRSPQFQDYHHHGDASRYAGMFLTFPRVFPGGARASELV